MLDVRACRGAWLSVLAFVAGTFGTVLASPAPAVAATPLSWSIVNVDGTNALNGVSCPSKSLCVAVDGAGKVLTSTNPTGGRSAWSAPVTIDGTASLNAVSCPSISLCVAVDNNGNVLTSTNPTGGASAWSAPMAIDETMVENGDHDLKDVSCASPTLCVAVDGNGYAFSSRTPTGGSSAWSAPTLVGAFAGTSYSVSCPSAALCAVVDGDLWTSINAGGSWSEPGTQLPQFLEHVGCSSSSLCVADDDDGNIVASTNPTGGASAWSKPAQVDTGGRILGAISCRLAFCAVLNTQDSDVFTSSDPTGGASAWTATPIDNAQPRDISCVSSSLCVASDNAGNVVVGFSLQPQTISLHVPAQSTVGSSALLSPTASSNLPVVLSFDKALTTNHACSVSGDTASFAHAGSCVIDATQAGGSGYAAAAPVQATITVGPGPQTIKFAAPSHGTVGESVWLSPLASSGLAVALNVDKSATTNNACSLSGSTVILAHAGSCVLDANQAGSADHAAAKQLQRTITVGPASQTIKVTAPSHGAVGGSAVLAPTASSGLPVVLSVDAASTTNGACSVSVSGYKVTFKAAGSCVLDASQAGDADYAAATQVKRAITVT